MKRAEILQTACDCVCGNREQDYGKPENNFSKIAALWNEYLLARDKNYPLNGKDVALMMALLKIARIATGRDKMDSFVDACGYIACAGECSEQEANNEQVCNTRS